MLIKHDLIDWSNAANTTLAATETVEAICAQLARMNGPIGLQAHDMVILMLPSHVQREPFIASFVKALSIRDMMVELKLPGANAERAEKKGGSGVKLKEGPQVLPVLVLAASDDKEYRRLQAWIAGRHHIDWQPYEEHLGPSHEFDPMCSPGQRTILVLSPLQLSDFVKYAYELLLRLDVGGGGGGGGGGQPLSQAFKGFVQSRSFDV